MSNHMNFKATVRNNDLNIDIFDEIGRDVYGQGFDVKRLQSFIDENPTARRINIRINSNGGDLFEGLAIYNLLKDSKKHINIKVLGVAASSASLIAMAGERISMYPTSTMMLHNCWTVAIGNAKELRSVADAMDKAMDIAKRAYLIKGNGSLDEELLNVMLDEETYLSPEEAVELGLCDEIINDNKPEQDDTKDTPQNSEQVIIDEEPKGWFF